MRALESLSDRLLSVFAPKAKASAACCAYQSHYYYCYCSGGYQYYKFCWSNCCAGACYACVKTSGTC